MSAADRCLAEIARLSKSEGKNDYILSKLERDIVRMPGRNAIPYVPVLRATPSAPVRDEAQRDLNSLNFKVDSLRVYIYNQEVKKRILRRYITDEGFQPKA